MNPLTTHYSPLSTRSFLFLTLAVSAIVLFPTVFWPFDYDQGTFAYGGAAILRGARPYLDFWDIKPPNIFYTYATAFALFGNSVRAVRIFDYLNALLTIALLFAIATRLWKNTPWRNVSAIMASLAFVLQYYIFGHWDTAQTETYSLPFLLASVLLVIPRRKELEFRALAFRSALAGASIGISFYFKFPNALFLGLVAAALWMHSGNDRRLHLKCIAWLLAGFIAAVGVESLYLALNGELLTLWHITTSSTASYVSNNYSGSFTFLDNLRTSFQALDLLWLVTGILGWSCWMFARRDRAKHTASVFPSTMLLILGCAIALLIVQLQNKGYKYHYAVLLPWADLLIGAGIGQVAQALSKPGWLPRGSIAAILAIILLTLSYVWSSLHPLHDRIAELLRIARRTQTANGYIATDSISNFVIMHTKPSDRIFIFGFQPYVYWKSGRMPTNRFLNTIHFKPSYVPSEEREELVHTLTGNPPELFLVETADRYTSQGNTNDDSRTTITLRYPELEKLLSTQYSPEDTLQSTIIYRRQH